MKRWVLSLSCVALCVGLPVIGIWAPEATRYELVSSDRAAIEGLRVVGVGPLPGCGLGWNYDVRVAIQGTDFWLRKFVITDLWLAERRVMKRFRHCKHLARIHVVEGTVAEELEWLRKEFPQCELVTCTRRESVTF